MVIIKYFHKIMPKNTDLMPDDAYKISSRARWIYVFALAVIGILSKYTGAVNINFSVLLMVGLFFSAAIYNIFPQYLLKHYFQKNPVITKMMVLAQLLLDIMIITIVIHYAGGIESISFIFYFFIIISSSFVYRKWGVYLVSLMCLIGYNFLIYAEFFGLVSHVTRYPFSNQMLYASPDVVIINTLAVSFVLVAGGFFVGYLSSLKSVMEERAQKELRKRLEEKRSMEEIKSKFITVLTHQSRTPLNHIKLGLEALSEEGLTKKQSAYMEDSQIALERLIILFDRLLKMQDLEKPQKMVRKEKISMSALINKCIKELHFLAKRQNIKFDFINDTNEPMECLGDPMLIHTVVEALMENAVDYSQPGSSVEISLMRKEDDLVLSVKDHGLSIKNADREKIFNKFFRTDEAMRTITDKSGLSLYLAKLIIEKHNGRIWFDSKTDGDTIFYISLKYAG
jgi:signal transduction histidine kinase